MLRGSNVIRRPGFWPASRTSTPQQNCRTYNLMKAQRTLEVLFESEGAQQASGDLARLTDTTNLASAASRRDGLAHHCLPLADVTLEGESRLFKHFPGAVMKE